MLHKNKEYYAKPEWTVSQAKKEIVTENEEDFKKIPGIKIINPFKKN